MMEIFVVEVQQYAFEVDVAKYLKAVTSEANSPSEIQSVFSPSTYRKAPVVLRMLQHIITDEVFRKGLIKYLHTHQFSSATPDDVWSALQAALDESDVPHDGYRLKEVMDTWIEQRHYPVVRVTRNYDTGETTLVQEHFRPHVKSGQEGKIDKDKWWIPLTYATQTNPNFSNTLPTHWLRPHDKNVIIDGIDPDDWIIVNLQQIGYYIVNYDVRNWQRIAEYLNSENYTKIHVLNRAQIISDAYHLLMADQLNIDTFLNITAYLTQETNYVPWFPMFVIFYDMADIFRLPGSEYLLSQIVEVLDELVKNVGYNEDPNESDVTKIKRMEALKWACKLGHTECRRMATIKLDEHLADPETYRVSPNLKKWTYCMGIMEANSSTWNKLLDTYIMEPKNTDILNYLSCSEDSDIIINFLNISENSSAIGDKGYYKIFDEIVRKHANKDSVLDYILENWEKAVIRGMRINHVFNIIINNVHSTKQLEKINEFVKNNISDGKMLTFIQKKISMRETDLVEMYDMLQKIVVTDEAE